MASDLGAWPAEQAMVLLDVLQRAGLQPEARRTREGIHVEVPEDQSDQAHQILVANMDVIARAARPSPSSRGRRGGSTAQRGRDAQRRDARTGRDSGERPLASERLRRLGPALALLIMGLLFSRVLPGFVGVLLVVGAVGAAIWLLGKQTEREDGG